VTNRKAGSRLRVTAYIAAALHDSGYRGKALDRARAYLRPRISKAKDAYTLALLAHVWLARRRDPLRAKLLDRLWAQRRMTKKGPLMPGPRSTLTYAAGAAGDLEATALTALVLGRAGDRPEAAALLLGSLAQRRSRYGAWSTTQTTILALRALLADRAGALPRGRLEVLVDGRRVKRLRLRGRRDQIRLIALAAEAGAPGTHQIALRYAGKGRLAYRLTASHWLPRKPAGKSATATKATRSAQAPRATSLAIESRFSATTLRAGESVALSVTLRNHGKRTVQMPMVRVPLPPGFDLGPQVIEQLVARSLASKIEQRGNNLLIYLERLQPGRRHELPLTLRSRFPLTAQLAPPSVYEYYRPQNRAAGQPQRIVVLPAAPAKRAATKTAAKDPVDRELDKLLASVK
jgi:hypothetical protein